MLSPQSFSSLKSLKTLQSYKTFRTFAAILRKNLQDLTLYLYNVTIQRIIVFETNLNNMNN
jgi:hypothetical protein